MPLAASCHYVLINYWMVAETGADPGCRESPVRLPEHGNQVRPNCSATVQNCVTEQLHTDLLVPGIGPLILVGLPFLTHTKTFNTRRLVFEKLVYLRFFRFMVIISDIDGFIANVRNLFLSDSLIFKPKTEILCLVKLWCEEAEIQKEVKFKYIFHKEKPSGKGLFIRAVRTFKLADLWAGPASFTESFVLHKQSLFILLPYVLGILLPSDSKLLQTRRSRLNSKLSRSPNMISELGANSAEAKRSGFSRCQGRT